MKLKRILATTAIALGTSFIAPVPAAFARVDFGISVGTPPPPLQVAPGPLGVAPGPGYVWTNGYWDWNGGNWAWVGGRWALPPHGHHVWVGPAYRSHHGHYYYHHGYWR
jgi:hypothetical protein